MKGLAWPISMARPLGMAVRGLWLIGVGIGLISRWGDGVDRGWYRVVAGMRAIRIIQG